MFDKFLKIFKKNTNEENKDSRDAAKERLHLVLMQDRANVSADFMELMKQEIIEVIKKYIEVDENSIDVKLTNKVNSDGTTGVPMLYANIPITGVKEDKAELKIERTMPKKEDVKVENGQNKDELEKKKRGRKTQKENNSSVKAENINKKSEQEEKKDNNKTEV